MAFKFNPTPPPDELRDYLYYEDGHIYRTDTKARVGCLNGNGYFCFTYQRRTYLVHRLIYWLHTGEWPQVVDHKSRNKTDNHIENLQAATQTQNAFNNTLRTDSTTGYTGVEKRGDRYNVSIKIDGKRYYLYGYKSLEAAALARDILAKIFYGDFARYGIAENAALKVGGVTI